jgi:hypothetical protein
MCHAFDPNPSRGDQVRLFQGSLEEAACRLPQARLQGPLRTLQLSEEAWLCTPHWGVRSAARPPCRPCQDTALRGPRGASPAGRRLHRAEPRGRARGKAKARRDHAPSAMQGRQRRPREPVPARPQSRRPSLPSPASSFLPFRFFPCTQVGGARLRFSPCAENLAARGAIEPRRRPGDSGRAGTAW